MSKIVNAAMCVDRNGLPVVVARVSPTKYKWASYSTTGTGGSFSNTTPGNAECVHMPEAEARKLIREDRSNANYPFYVPATDRRFASRISAMGDAVLVARVRF